MDNTHLSTDSVNTKQPLSKEKTISYVIYRRDKHHRRITFDVYFQPAGTTRQEYVETFKTIRQAKAWIKNKEHLRNALTKAPERPQETPNPKVGTRLRVPKKTAQTA